MMTKLKKRSKKKKLGIITWHDHNNPGGSLQAFALLTAINNLGYSARIINYHQTHRSQFKRCIKWFISTLTSNLPHKYYYPYEEFYGKYYKLTKEYLPNTIGGKLEKFDCIISGSDQIWAPNVFDPNYMLECYHGKKISYAASIGLNYIPDNLVEKYTELLSDYTAISVRESIGVELIKTRCGLKSKVVLDPTLLLETKDYRKMQKPYYNIKKPYVFCYFLNENNDYESVVNNCAESKGFHVCGISKDISNSEWINILDKVGPCEFLWLIDNASIVLTDSYHGSIFSLLFSKPLVLFERFDENSSINQNSRIYQLVEYFNIPCRERLGKNVYEMLSETDYKNFDITLSSLKNESFMFLREALKSC